MCLPFTHHSHYKGPVGPGSQEAAEYVIEFQETPSVSLKQLSRSLCSQSLQSPGRSISRVPQRIWMQSPRPSQRVLFWATGRSASHQLIGKLQTVSRKKFSQRWKWLCLTVFLCSVQREKNKETFDCKTLIEQNVLQLCHFVSQVLWLDHWFQSQKSNALCI